MNPQIPWKCPKRIGFLFPHPCERQSPAACPHCDNGTIVDPYATTQRPGFNSNEYDTYNHAETFGFGGGNSGGAGATMDFTEADGASLTASDKAFEDDLSAS